MSIKAIYVAEYASLRTLVQQVFDTRNNLIKSDIAKIGGKIRALNARTTQRNKLKTIYGIWFVTHINGNAYGLCTNETYPERHAYKLIDNISYYIQNNEPSEKKLNSYVKKQCQQMMDPQKFDKVRMAQKQVNLLQSDLNMGIKKIINNQEQLTQLDDHAQHLKILASQFHDNAQQVESVTFWKKWKKILLLIAVIMGILTIVFVSLMLSN